MNFEISNLLLEKKFEQLSDLKKLEKPPEGWIKAICQALWITSSQFAKKLGITQPRVIEMQKNEMNLKLSTMQKIADAFGFEFIYAFVPKTSIKAIRYNQAEKKAKIILEIMNRDMSLQQRRVLNKALLKEITEDFLYSKQRIWDED